MKTAVGSELGLSKDILFLADGPKTLPNALNHRLQQILLLPLAEGLRMDNDLVFAVHRCDSVIALNHTAGGLHLGRIIVGDVAFARRAALARFVIVVFEPASDLRQPLAKRFHILPLTGGEHFLAPVMVAIRVAFDHRLDGLLHLGRLSPKVGLGAAPFLGSIGWELDPVYGKHLLANQAHFVTEKQDFPEDGDGLLVHGRNEFRNSGDMGSAVGAKGHEDYVLGTALSDLTARGDTA